MLRFITFFTIERQFIAFVLALVLGLTLQFTWGLAWSWPFFLIVLALVFKYIFLGTVNAAAMSMQMGDWDKTERILNYTKKPEWLRFGYQGLFYLVQSRVFFQKDKVNEAEKTANKALKIGGLPDDLAAMLYLLLIQIAGKRQQQQKMQDLLKDLKKLHVTQPMLKEQIEEIDLMMKGKHPMQKKMMGGQVNQMQNFMTKRGKR